MLRSDHVSYACIVNLHLCWLKNRLSGPACVLSHHMRSGAKTEEQLQSTTLRSRTHTMLHVNSSWGLKNCRTSEVRSSDANSSVRQVRGESRSLQRERLPRGALADDMQDARVWANLIRFMTTQYEIQVLALSVGPLFVLCLEQAPELAQRFRFRRVHAMLRDRVLHRRRMCKATLLIHAMRSEPARGIAPHSSR